MLTLAQLQQRDARQLPTGDVERTLDLFPHVLRDSVLTGLWLKGAQILPRQMEPRMREYLLLAAALGAALEARTQTGMTGYQRIERELQRRHIQLAR